MLLVMAGSILAYRMMSKEDGPPRDFVELELAGADHADTGSCYSLSTVLVANFTSADATRTWSTAREGQWAFALDRIAEGRGGPVRVLLKYTFEKRDGLVHLVSVEVPEDMNGDLAKNLDELLETPNARHSTPVERCEKPGATGYRYRPRR